MKKLKTFLLKRILKEHEEVIVHSYNPELCGAMVEIVYRIDKVLFIDRKIAFLDKHKQLTLDYLRKSFPEFKFKYCLAYKVIPKAFLIIKVVV